MDIPFLLLDGILSELQEKPRRKDELQKKVHRRICVRDITFLSDIFISQTRSKESNSFFACRYISKLLQDGLSFLVKVARHVQGTQNRKFIKFLLYIKKNYRNCFCVRLWCKTFRYFTRFQSYSFLLVFGWLWWKLDMAF